MAPAYSRIVLIAACACAASAGMFVGAGLVVAVVYPAQARAVAEVLTAQAAVLTAIAGVIAATRERRRR